MSALLLSPDQTAEALDPVELLESLRVALVAIATGEASVPPRIAAVTPGGALAAMPGFVPGLGLAAKLVSIFADPDHPGRSAHQGVVALFDHTDGRLQALMNGDVITAVRTAAAATIAMQALARPDPELVAVIGTGVQAAAQLRLLQAIGSTAQVVVGGRDPGRARAAAASTPGTQVAANIAEAVRGADVVFCCTDATTPVLDPSWVRPGMHVSSVGGSHGPELDPETIAGGALFVEWMGAASSAPPAGAHELQDVDPARVVLVGDVLDGRHPGRADVDQVTVYKSTGHAALDVAAAATIYRRATERGWGTTVEL